MHFVRIAWTVNHLSHPLVPFTSLVTNRPVSVPLKEVHRGRFRPYFRLISVLSMIWEVVSFPSTGTGTKRSFFAFVRLRGYIEHRDAIAEIPETRFLPCPNCHTDSEWGVCGKGRTARVLPFFEPLLAITATEHLRQRTEDFHRCCSVRSAVPVRTNLPASWPALLAMMPCTRDVPLVCVVRRFSLGFPVRSVVVT